jgi:hypothetical protein
MPLLSVVRSVLECPSAGLVGWREEAIDYRAYLPGRRLARLSGTARCDGVERGWSVVRKSGAAAREVQAYAAGWLDVPGFRRARCHRAAGDEIWLEDLADRRGHRWPLDAFELAAAALGRFSGTHLVSPPPDAPWLSRDWMDRHQDPAALARRPHDQPTQARLRETLSALPQTICHHDASHANLFLTGDEVVAIDWEGVGWGAAGADLATLVVGTMRRGDFDPARADELEEAACSGYARGLAEAGWRDVAAARLGYAAAVGLRWPIVALAPDTPLARFVMARSAEATGGRA